jgi:hypothetical protein
VLQVNHLRGADSFGCDLVSAVSETVRDKAITDQSVAEADILRYIEGQGAQQSHWAS